MKIKIEKKVHLNQLSYLHCLNHNRVFSQLFLYYWHAMRLFSMVALIPLIKANTNVIRIIRKSQSHKDTNKNFRYNKDVNITTPQKIEKMKRVKYQKLPVNHKKFSIQMSGNIVIHLNSVFHLRKYHIYMSFICYIYSSR